MARTFIEEEADRQGITPKEMLTALTDTNIREDSPKGEIASKMILNLIDEYLNRSLEGGY